MMDSIMLKSFFFFFLKRKSYIYNMMKMFMSSHISFEISGSIDARHFEACEFEGYRTSP